MKPQRTTATLYGTLLLVIVQASLVKSEEKTYQCKDHDLSFSKEQVDLMKSCGEKIGVKTLEQMTIEKMPCFAKCVIEEAGLVDHDGKPHKEKILNAIDKGAPKEVQDAYKAAAEKCIDEHGGAIKPAEPTCASYAPLAVCFTMAFQSICHG